MMATDQNVALVIARRVFAGALVVLAAGLATSPLLYWLQFARLPPTRLNLLFWISPSGAECVRRAMYAERAGILGTDVTLGDMCPNSKYGPGTYSSVLVGPYIWLAILVGIVSFLAWTLLEESRSTPRRSGPRAPDEARDPACGAAG